MTDYMSCDDDLEGCLDPALYECTQCSYMCENIICAVCGYDKQNNEQNDEQNNEQNDEHMNEQNDEHINEQNDEQNKIFEKNFSKRYKPPPKLKVDQQANCYWICHNCDKNNNVNDKRCGYCNTYKSNPWVEYDKWICSRCSFTNTCVDTICNMCQLSKRINDDNQKINDNNKKRKIEIDAMYKSYWTCHKCNEINDEYNNKCHKCDTLQSNSNIMHEEWACSTCTFVNIKTNISCDMCKIGKNPIPPELKDQSNNNYQLVEYKDQNTDPPCEICSFSNNKKCTACQLKSHNLNNNNIWFCSKCTLENNCIDNECDACQTPRYITQFQDNPNIMNKINNFIGKVPDA